MLLCDVTLGRQGVVAPGQRRPPPGFHSGSSTGIHAVYLNDQVGDEGWAGLGWQACRRCRARHQFYLPVAALPQSQLGFAPSSLAPLPACLQAYPAYVVHYR